MQKNTKLQNVRHAAALLAATIMLGACASTSKPRIAAVVPAIPAGQNLLQGRAIYLERMAMAPGATLEVQLIGERSGATSSTTIAMVTFSDLHGPPYDFTLAYDSSRITNDMRCSLRALLRDSQGHLAFATAASVPIALGEARRVEFRLVRAVAN